MFKKNFIFIAACALLSLLSSFHPIQPVQKQYLKTIIIDAGHGLPDPGAQGDYSNESDVSLAIALKLGSRLQELLPDVNIIYTRNDANLPNHLTNKDVANRWRAQFANDNRGDLFICIHCNDAPPVRHSEFEGYTYQTYKKGMEKNIKRK